jgi:hypothetical protein
MIDKNKEVDLQEHWDSKYASSEENKLGWFETDLSPMLALIKEANIGFDDSILLAGAGNTRLLDELLHKGFSNIIATDISSVALNDLESRLDNPKSVQFIVDDLTKPETLSAIEKLDLWIDRAVLHFFLEEDQLKKYVELLHAKLRSKAHVIFAEFSSEGAMMCSGLPVKRYNIEMLEELLGPDFDLVNNFSYTYMMPSGAERPYIYSLFKRK